MTSSSSSSAAPSAIPPGTYDVELGSTWDVMGGVSRDRITFHTLKCDFKPKSVSHEPETYIAMGKNGDVQVAVTGEKDALTMYKGGQKQAKEAKECLLFFDPITNRVCLEKVSSNIAVKKTRDPEQATEAHFRSEIDRLRKDGSRRPPLPQSQPSQQSSREKPSSFSSSASSTSQQRSQQPSHQRSQQQPSHQTHQQNSHHPLASLHQPGSILPPVLLPPPPPPPPPPPTHGVGQHGGAPPPPPPPSTAAASHFTLPSERGRTVSSSTSSSEGTTGSSSSADTDDQRTITSATPGHRGITVPAAPPPPPPPQQQQPIRDQLHSRLYEAPAAARSSLSRDNNIMADMEMSDSDEDDDDNLLLRAMDQSHVTDSPVAPSRPLTVPSDHPHRPPASLSAAQLQHHHNPTAANAFSSLTSDLHLSESSDED